MAKKKLNPTETINSEKGKVTDSPDLGILCVNAETERLRSIVTSLGTVKTNWLLVVSDKQLHILCELIRKNNSLKRIIEKVVQERWKIYEGVDPNSLMPAFEKFAKKALGELEIVGNALPPAERKITIEFKKRAEEIAGLVDGYDTLAWLVNEQRKRIETFIQREQNTGEQMLSIDASVRELSNLIEKYVKMGVQLGVLSTKAPQLNVSITGKFNHIVSNLTDGGSAMVKAAEKFLTVLDDIKPIELIQGTDGNWKIPDDSN